MANQPTAPAPQPPPDIPAGIDNTLANYLRTFALWCRNGFADKLSSSAALPGVMVQAYDAAAGTTPKVFIIRVDSAGVVSATPIALGGGRP